MRFTDNDDKSEAYTDMTIVRYPEILRIYLRKYLGIENYQ